MADLIAGPGDKIGKEMRNHWRLQPHDLVYFLGLEPVNQKEAMEEMKTSLSCFP
jgi:hypothetical protein